MPRNLPNNPSLEHLKNQAKALQRADASITTRAQAQHAIAREYGFASWAKLRAHLKVVDRYMWRPDVEPAEESPADRFVRLACLTYGGDDPARWHEAADLLAARPDLAAASIHTAAASGDVDAATAILDADPDAVHREGGPYNWQPLMYAAYSRLPGVTTLPVARLLLDRGADANVGYLWAGMPSPFTALTGALGGGEGGQPPHPESVVLARLLLEAGADANDSQALYNRGLVGWEQDEPEHIALLLEFGLGRGDGGVWHDRMGFTHPSPHELLEDELLRAAEKDLPRWAALVLDAGVDVNGLGTRHPARENVTAWEHAVRNGNTRVVALLDAAGARPPTADPVLELLGAAMNGERTVPADPAWAAAAVARRPHHITTAADRGRLDAVRLMVDLGFDVNVVDASHAHRPTALHYAAHNDDVAMVQLLVELGADPTIRDRTFNGTPLGWAEHSGATRTAALLAAAPGKP